MKYEKIELAIITAMTAIALECLVSVFDSSMTIHESQQLVVLFSVTFALYGTLHLASWAIRNPSNRTWGNAIWVVGIFALSWSISDGILMDITSNMYKKLALHL